MDLRELTEMSAVSGNEQALRRKLIEVLTPLCDEVHIDKMGNVNAFKKGTDAPNHPHVLLAAHMDEVGFIVTSVTNDGMLKFKSVGGIDPRVIVSKRVLVGDKKTPGIIGATAIHLQTAADRQNVLGYDSLYIDIGAKSKEEAQSDCPPASYVMFDTAYQTFGEGYICAKALDDRVGIFSLIEVLKGSYPCDMTCLFTSEEEVGCRGALGGAYASEADVAIILEGTTANDLGDIEDSLKVCSLGKGVAVSFMDNASIADKSLYATIIEIASNKGIAHQVKRFVSGGNEGGAIQRSRGGKKTVVLSVPCRYIHSPSSVVKYDDVIAQQMLVKAFLQNPILKG